jgi:hypothetical protein
VEYGYKPTEKLLIWADLANSPEILAAQVTTSQKFIFLVWGSKSRDLCRFS